ncbi:hypothetical protein, partial [Oceanispirochaeta sp. M1]
MKFIKKVIYKIGKEFIGHFENVLMEYLENNISKKIDIFSANLLSYRSNIIEDLNIFKNTNSV